MPLQTQATHAGYSADNLKPHDAGIRWVKEFGTNVTLDVGDAFQTGAAPSTQPFAAINSRFGSLNISSMADNPAELPVKGQTFVLPPWADFASIPPVESSVRTAILYAHFRMNYEPENASELPTFRASLILAPLGFVGQVPNVGYASISIQGNVATDPARPESDVVVEIYGNGGNAPPDTSDLNPAWGNDIYVQCLMATDLDEKETEIAVSISRNGIAWTRVGFIEVEGGLRRVGLGTSGHVIAGLDWVRIYDYAPVTVDGMLEPPPPATGGKMFLP